MTARTMRAWWMGIASIAVISQVAVASAQPNETRIVRMQVGEQVSLDSTEVERYSLSGPTVVEIRAHEHGIDALAQHQGQQRVVFFLSGGRQRVYLFFVRAADVPPAEPAP